ncbi:MAG: acyltransferase [Clostridia bacterium]|nr:acyltransferase [Clostridia bacterium]
MPEKDARKLTYPSIDLFRYFCAIFVIAGHTHPLEDINPVLGYIAVQLMPRITVPFFFCIAGYFYIEKLEAGKKPFKTYFTRLLLTYAIWSVPYFLLDFFSYGYKDIRGFFIDSVYGFLAAGTAYHFWFFPAVIFSVCLTTLLFKSGLKKALIPISLICYIMGTIGCAYNKIGIHIPVLSILYSSSYFKLIRRVLLMGFPFFTSGYCFSRLRTKEWRFLEKPVLLFVLSLLLWLFEIALVERAQVQDNIFMTFGLYPFVIAIINLLLHYPLQPYAQIARHCRVIANFSYYVHPLVITGISAASQRFLGIEQISSTPLFILTVLVTLAFGFVIAKTKKKNISFVVR